MYTAENLKKRKNLQREPQLLGPISGWKGKVRSGWCHDKFMASAGVSGQMRSGYLDPDLTSPGSSKRRRLSAGWLRFALAQRRRAAQVYSVSGPPSAAQGPAGEVQSGCEAWPAR